jgi:hypothetical protein
MAQRIPSVWMAELQVNGTTYHLVDFGFNARHAKLRMRNAWRDGRITQFASIPTDAAELYLRVRPKTDVEPEMESPDAELKAAKDESTSFKLCTIDDLENELVNAYVERLDHSALLFAV